MKVIVKHFKGKSWTQIKHIQHPYEPEWIKTMELEDFLDWQLSESDLQKILSIPYFIRCIHPDTVNQVNPEYCLIKQFTDQAWKEAQQQIEDRKDWYMKARAKHTQAINTNLK